MGSFFLFCFAVNKVLFNSFRTSRTPRLTSCWAPWCRPCWRTSDCRLSGWETSVWVRLCPSRLLWCVGWLTCLQVGEDVTSVCSGNVLQPGAGALMARVAHFLRWVWRLWLSPAVCLRSSPLRPPFSGFPESVPVYTVNRQCSSGLQALFNVAGNAAVLPLTQPPGFYPNDRILTRVCRSHQEQSHRPRPRLRVGLTLDPDVVKKLKSKAESFKHEEYFSCKQVKFNFLK